MCHGAFSRLHSAVVGLDRAFRVLEVEGEVQVMVALRAGGGLVSARLWTAWWTQDDE